MNTTERLLRIFAYGDYLRMDTDQLEDLFIEVNRHLSKHQSFEAFRRVTLERFNIVNEVESITLDQIKAMLND